MLHSRNQNEKGICIIAGDIFPIDVISHVPIFCEEKEVQNFHLFLHTNLSFTPFLPDISDNSNDISDNSDKIVAQVPYIYVPSKQDLGAAASTKRPTSVILVQVFHPSNKKTPTQRANYL